VERLVVQALREKKAQNIVLILLGESADWARSLVICDAPVEIHRRALRDSIEDTLQKAGLWRSGDDHSEDAESWTLMDLGDTIVNIFSTQARLYYDLERTWGEPNTTFRFD
jgi:ribosome-associated protein